jgi:hypothetical protein
VTKFNDFPGEFAGRKYDIGARLSGIRLCCEEAARLALRFRFGRHISWQRHQFGGGYLPVADHGRETHIGPRLVHTNVNVP